MVSASGGGRAITTLNAAAKESAHRLPRFLSDGRQFLYYIVSADSNRAPRSSTAHLMPAAELWEDNRCGAPSEADHWLACADQAQGPENCVH